MPDQRILIFDQEEAVRESLHLVLSEEGFRCHAVKNKEEMRQILTEHAIHLMIVDSQLLAPGLVKSLKKNYASMLILLLSGYTDIEITVTAITEGADNFLLKPLDFDELIALVRKYLSPSSNQIK